MRSLEEGGRGQRGGFVSWFWMWDLGQFPPCLPSGSPGVILKGRR